MSGIIRKLPYNHVFLPVFSYIIIYAAQDVFFSLRVEYMKFLTYDELILFFNKPCVVSVKKKLPAANDKRGAKWFCLVLFYLAEYIITASCFHKIIDDRYGARVGCFQS